MNIYSKFKRVGEFLNHSKREIAKDIFITLFASVVASMIMEREMKDFVVGVTIEAGVILSICIGKRIIQAVPIVQLSSIMEPAKELCKKLMDCKNLKPEAHGMESV